MSHFFSLDPVSKAQGMRILWILPYLPYPTTSGGKLRQYHLIRILAERGYRITLLVQSKVLPDAETREQLAKITERLIVLPRRSLKHPKTLLAAAIAPYPLLVSVNGFAPELTDCFQKLLQEHWDVIQLEHSYTLQPYMQALQGRSFLLTEHNIESSLGAATYQHLSSILKPYIVYDQRRYRRWEKKVLTAATRVAAVTEDDASALAAIRGRPVDVVINGVSCSSFLDVNPDIGSRRLLFVGNFEYPPNEDAVLWCVEEIMPKIWAAAPDAVLSVCGYAMPKGWARRWTDPRIEWRGFVQDLKAEQKRSAMFFAPLREGGGSKLKVLEAMAAGLPVVTTSQGRSGLKVKDGQEMLTGDNPVELCDAVLRLLSDSRLANDMGEAGRDYVSKHHDWDVAVNQLEIIYREMVHAYRS